MPAIAGSGPSVTFAVERFGWVGDDRLEIAGRWFGLRGHRFLRPTLDVEVHDGHRRLLALLEHKPWAADDGQEWVAAFGWEGEPLELFAAELAVGPDLAVELPTPQGGRPAAGPEDSASPAPEARPVGRPRGELEFELAAAREAAEDLVAEVERVRGAHAARVEELQRRLTAEREAGAQLREELAAARAAVASTELESTSRLEQLVSEREAAVTASAAALAEAKKAGSERDAAMRERAAAEQERDAAVHARNSARQERNAWMSRARRPTAERRASATTDRGAQAPEPTPPEAVEAPPASRPEPAQPGRGRPGVRTVRIGFDDGPAVEASMERRTPSLSDQMPPLRGQARTAGMPPWALPLAAALVLILAVAVLVLVVL